MRSYSNIRKHRRLHHAGRWISRHPAWLHRVFSLVDSHTKSLQRLFLWLVYWLKFLRILNPMRYITRLDWYIIRKFIGTYFFSIALIITISIVYDVNENLAKFTQSHAPLKAIVFDYYFNFAPYLANLFSALFVFIAVIYFTSKLAGNSEIIAMLAAGISFKRLLRPYMISCIFLSGLSYYLSAYVIPHGTIVRHNFETLYQNRKTNSSANDVQLMVEPGVIAYIQSYDNNSKQGYGFCLDKFENKKLVSHLTAMEVQYDTISDSKYHWKLSNWKLRQMKGLREYITTGASKDSNLRSIFRSKLIAVQPMSTFTKWSITSELHRRLPLLSSPSSVLPSLHERGKAAWACTLASDWPCRSPILCCRPCLPHLQ